jgi:uncharacterized protein YjlB
MTTRPKEHVANLAAILLDDDGVIPNNPRLPVLLYRGALNRDVAGPEPEAAILARFAGNGWGGGWVDGIYPYHHYHPDAHEVLGIARGWAKVQLGGSAGPVVELRAGDAVLLPAGVGHCRIESEDLCVVGAYPRGQEAPEIARAGPAAHARAKASIAGVPRPEHDPVHGRNGPLDAHWP